MKQLLKPGSGYMAGCLGMIKTLHNKNYFLAWPHDFTWTLDCYERGLKCAFALGLIFLCSGDSPKEELLSTWCSFSPSPRMNTHRSEPNLNPRAEHAARNRAIPINIYKSMVKKKIAYFFVVMHFRLICYKVLLWAFNFYIVNLPQIQPQLK